MFFRTRERLERLERSVDRILEAIEAKQSARTDPLESFAKLFGTMASSQSDLVASLGEIAVRSAARRAGIRGGSTRARTAERRPDGKFLPRRHVEAKPSCPLCIDPNYRYVTIPMIQEHRRHEEARIYAQQQPLHPDPDAGNGAIDEGGADAFGAGHPVQ